jgi:N-acetylglucosamine repressor
MEVGALEKKYNNINSIKMRAMNTALVFDAIRTHKDISRAELAKIVGLTTATITNLVNKAIADGYIVETGMGSSQGGRRPKVLKLNNDAGYAIGIELNIFEIICILADFNANILIRESVDIEVTNGPEIILNQMVALINSLIDRSGVPRNKIMGIGVATAGPLDHTRGIMINPPNFVGWRNVPVKDVLEQKTGITTYIEKETSAAALCESWLDVDNKYKRILAMNVFKVGIGGGLVLDGEIYHGYKDAGLEIGHMTVDNFGAQCRCGRTGCLEVMADGEAAVRYYKSATGNEISINEIVERAKNGDEDCINAVKKCGRYLGKAITSLISVLAPDVIFIGGDFIENNDIMFNECLRVAKEQTYPFTDAEIEVRRASLGKYSGAFGSIAKVLNAALSTD